MAQRQQGSSQDDQQKLDALAAQLSSLGAESRTERSVKRVLPWFVSLAIHLGIVAIALMVTWTVARNPKKDESVLIVADFQALAYDPVVRGNVAEETTSETTSETQPLQQTQIAPLDPLPLTDMKSGVANPLDSWHGAFPIAGSPQARFVPPSERGGVRFAGARATNARKIVYVIDASGSMVSHLKTVVSELMRSIQNLTPQQSFSVIFFNERNIKEYPPAGKLKTPGPDQSQKLQSWIDAQVTSSGGTNPIQAIEAAMKLEPDVVFLLSQDISGYGQFEIDQRDLLARLDTLNPINPATNRRKTQINCIQFLQQDKLETMRRIAELHGGPGGYTFLTSDALGSSR